MAKTTPIRNKLASILLASVLCLAGCGSSDQKPEATGKYPDTVENRKKSGQIFLDFMDVMHDKKYDEAEKLTFELEKYNPSSGPKHRGEIAYEQGRFADADRLVMEAIKLEPENYAYWEYAAIYAFRQGHEKEAMERAAKSISLKGTDGKPSTAYLIRGMVYRHEGQYQKAIAEFDETLKLYPDNVEARYYKATCQDALGQSNDALATFGDVLRWEPTLQSAIKRRLAIYMRRGDNSNAKKELANSQTQAKSKLMSSAKDWIPSDLTTEQVKKIVQNPKLTED